jgi:hypothetical protein
MILNILRLLYWMKMTKPIWVFVAGTYRTASTTQYEMARDVVRASNSGFAIGYHNERRLRDFDALNMSGAIKETFDEHSVDCPFIGPPQFSRSPHYIVCKVFEYLPAGFRDGPSHGQLIHRQRRLKAIVSIRDPRDIATSMKRREEQRSDDGRRNGEPFDFENLVTQKFPIWLGALTRWIDLGPGVTLVSRFEDFTIDRQTEVRRIANHLGVTLVDEEIERVANAYEIEAMRKRKDEFWQRRRENPDECEDGALPSIPALLFASSGQWQRELSEEEARLTVEANREFCERFGYEPQSG